ncbi:MAG: acyl-CoA dehydrogenase family protein [Porticoccaceae bacterium]
MTSPQALPDSGRDPVDNQAGPPPPRNLYTTDPLLQKAMAGAPYEWAQPLLTRFGELIGRCETLALANDANRFAPQLHSLDSTGQRLDEVRYHPAYHQLMEVAIGHGVHSIAWTAPTAGHSVHVALEYLFAQVEGGVCCPVTMTYAGLPLLKLAPRSISGEWLPKVLGTVYDSGYKPAAEKAGLTLGMAMTERQGGSDLRTNSTRAELIQGDLYRLFGHKWFCSAPMSDGFFTLARTGSGLSCFLVPRWRPDGTRNPFVIQRLKDKLGNRSNASAEIEYRDTWGYLVGEEGRGIATLMTMVRHTRLDTCLAPVALMRQGLVQALHNARHRKAFGKLLIHQPLMLTVLDDLALELEAGMALLFAIADSFDQAATPEGEAMSRLASGIGKFLLNKVAPGHVCETLELLGGNGYVEENLMPRLYREAPLNGIWEGSGNVICLDVLRTLHEFPDCGERFIAAIAPATGAYPEAATQANSLYSLLKAPGDEDFLQAAARHIVQGMARLWQCALLVDAGENGAADRFAATRIKGAGVVFGGALPRQPSEENLVRVLGEL